MTFYRYFLKLRAGLVARIFSFEPLHIYPCFCWHIESFLEDKKPFKCNICDISFSDRQDLNRHIETVNL